MFLLDESNQVIFDLTGEWIGKCIDDYSAEIKNVFSRNDETYYRLNVNGDAILAAGKASSQNGLKVIAIQKEKAVFAVTDQMIKVLTIVFTFLIIITFFIISRMILRVTRPLDNMAYHLQDMDLDNPKEELSVEVTCREVEALTQAYNFMIQKIQYMLDSEYKSVIREQEYQLALVRSKIHPHFLYNTLDAVRMSAVMNQDEETADMILSLSDFFRKSIITDKVVLLEDEFSQVKSYVSLLKIRYEKLKVELFIDEDLRFLEFPSFVIQPLVENAFIHGIKPRGYEGEIAVRAEITGKGIYTITVCDNGKGVSDEMLERINHDIEEMKQGNLNMSNSHIGLLSVSQQVIHFLEKTEISRLKI